MCTLDHITTHAPCSLPHHLSPLAVSEALVPTLSANMGLLLFSHLVDDPLPIRHPLHSLSSVSKLRDSITLCLLKDGYSISNLGGWHWNSSVRLGDGGGAV